MCFTLRLHMSVAPTQGGLTQALGGNRAMSVIVRKKIFDGEMPSQVIADLRRNGATWQELTREFILSFPETHTSIMSNLRTLGLGMYAQEPSSLAILDYLILRQLSAAGVPVRVPPEPS